MANLLRKALRWYTVQRRDQHEGGHDLRVLRPDGTPWRWALEVKRSKSWRLGDALGDTASGEATTLWSGWWAQAVRQAEAVNRLPLLVCRADRRPWWVFAVDTDVGASWPHHTACLELDAHTVGVWRLNDVLAVLDASSVSTDIPFYVLPQVT